MSSSKLFKFNKIYYYSYLLLVILLINLSFAANNQAVTQAQNKLKQLDNQINQLKQTLASTADKRVILNQELTSTEKKIATNIQKLQLVQHELAAKQQKVNILEQRIKEFNHKLTMQQRLLSEHIRIRYKMGEYQPLKWIINQNNFFSISRLLTFHQYLAYARQQIIDKMSATKKNLAQDQEVLKAEIEDKQALQIKLNSFQEKLKRTQNYHAIIIQSLNNEIQNKKQTLLEYERNKENLSRLLKTLTLQSNSFTQPQYPFIQMRHKLKHPIKTERSNAKKMNQGITFFAHEGVPVYAIYPGKVVFSDWLNGYGFLLIIDHGQGFMTLYAHNQSLYKRKGTAVYQGEQIAAVGHTGGIKQNGLYFEIRQHGKAIPPLDWLS